MKENLKKLSQKQTNNLIENTRNLSDFETKMKTENRPGPIKSILIVVSLKVKSLQIHQIYLVIPVRATLLCCILFNTMFLQKVNITQIKCLSQKT